MKQKLTLTTLVALAGLTTKMVGAATIHINGGASFGGWISQGNSLDDGIWADGETDVDFDIYTTYFTFDSSAHGVTGSPSGSPGFSGTGYTDGNRIIGIGIRMNNDGSGGSDLDNAVPTLKFDPNRNSYQPASSLGANDGQDSSSTYSDQGDFNLQTGGIQQTGKYNTPSNFSRNDSSGMGDYSTALGADNSPFRSYYHLDPSGKDGFQIFVDLTELAKSPWNIAEFDSYNLVVNAPGDGQWESTSTVHTDLATIPEPSSAALLFGAACLGVFTRRVRR